MPQYTRYESDGYTDGRADRDANREPRAPAAFCQRYGYGNPRYPYTDEYIIAYDRGYGDTNSKPESNADIDPINGAYWDNATDANFDVYRQHTADYIATKLNAVRDEILNALRVSEPNTDGAAYSCGFWDGYRDGHDNLEPDASRHGNDNVPFKYADGYYDGYADAHKHADRDPGADIYTNDGAADGKRDAKLSTERDYWVAFTNRYIQHNVICDYYRHIYAAAYEHAYAKHHTDKPRNRD